MHKSLTILLPVHNAQGTLARQITTLLDFLPEISTEFEILIVDDASTDSTEDVALDLARRFPQVRVLRQSQRLGHQRAIEAGLARTSGEIVFINDPGIQLKEAELLRLWRLKDDPELVMARAQVQAGHLDQHLLSRLITWGEALKQPKSPPNGSIQMLRRSALETLATTENPTEEISIDRNGMTDAVRLVRQNHAGRVPAPPTITPPTVSLTSEQVSYF
ncbi:MAG: glycosyltransferase family 2 protein [Pirellulaceae bacterium]|nr:glycosyltransferase family 2 protein [Pirellulaceae bacterium]